MVDGGLSRTTKHISVQEYKNDEDAVFLFCLANNKQQNDLNPCASDVPKPLEAKKKKWQKLTD